MNKIDKFGILFGKPKFGWIAILIQKNGEDLVYISGSGAFNPFFEYVENIQALENDINVKWEIEEEGPETHITFKCLKNNIIKVTIKKLCDKSNKYWIPKQSFYVQKDLLIKELKEKGYELYINNKKELECDIYDMSFKGDLLKGETKNELH